MKVVVDASVAIKWVIRNPVVEANVDQALMLLRAIRSHAVDALVPPHFKAEVLAVVARARPQMLPLMFRIFSSIPVEVVESDALYWRACRLSVELQHHLFDTLYHAAAFETEAIFVTADEAYCSKAAGLGSVRLLSEFSLET